MIEGLLKIDVSELASGSYRQLADPAEVGTARAPQDLPSSRAGGQDDVS